jgi:hyperosmotically inducible protein
MKLLATFLLLGGLALGQSQSSNNTQQPSSNAQLAMRPATQNPDEQRIVKEVRHELVMLPYYSLFDDLEYSVNGGTVTLLGSVTNPTLKSDAENAVKRIEGVTQVNNQIKVLPPSPMDDQIRRQVARSISNQGGLYRYFMGAVPSIHIIVDNGHVTLKGVVDNQADDTQAKMAANQVPGVFSVKDELQVANQSQQR